MPFTVSHVAAVLPLTARPVRRWLPTAPLVIGSMVPDVPSTLGALSLRNETHELTSVFTLDVAITALGCLLWAYVLRPVVADLLPALAARWEPPPGRSRSALPSALLWYAAAAVGCLTHVVWDAFTHPGGAAFQWVPLEGLDLRWYEPLQLASSMLGLVVLLAWAAHWWRTHPPVTPAPSPQHLAGARLRAWGAAAVVLTASGWAAAVRGTGADSPHRLAVELGFGALSGALVGAVAVALVYRLTLLRT